MVKIYTPTKIILPSESEKILGIRIQNDLRWTQFLRENKDDNLIQSLYQRVNASSLLSNIADFKTRKMLANGISMSRAIYMITIWSSCTKEMLNSIQVIQNRAARLVTKKFSVKHIMHRAKMF